MSITRNIVGRLHVSASRRDVIRAVHAAFSPQALTRKHRKQRHAIYRRALSEHAGNQQLYRHVVSGNIG